MVKTLHLSPDTEVPYMIKINELNKILIEVRRKLLKFVEKAREKLFLK